MIDENIQSKKKKHEPAMKWTFIRIRCTLTDTYI